MSVRFLIASFMIIIVLLMTGCNENTSSGNESEKDVENNLEEQVEVVNIETTFRNATWGMSKEEVEKVEVEDKISDDGKSLLYSTQVNNLNAALLYRFVDNQLVRTGYVIEENYTNENQYIYDFDDLKKALSEKYGNPISDDVIWHSDLYKDDVDEWGFAVSLGDLEYIAKWDTGETDITLRLFGNNYDINLLIVYVGKETIYLIEEEKSKSIENDL